MDSSNEIRISPPSTIRLFVPGGVGVPDLSPINKIVQKGEAGIYLYCDDQIVASFRSCLGWAIVPQPSTILKTAPDEKADRLIVREA